MSATMLADSISATAALILYLIGMPMGMCVVRYLAAAAFRPLTPSVE